MKADQPEAACRAESRKREQTNRGPAEPEEQSLTSDERFERMLKQRCDHFGAVVAAAGTVRESLPAKSVSSNKTSSAAAIAQRQSF